MGCESHSLNTWLPWCWNFVSFVGGLFGLLGGFAAGTGLCLHRVAPAGSSSSAQDDTPGPFVPDGVASHPSTSSSSNGGLFCGESTLNHRLFLDIR